MTVLLVALALVAAALAAPAADKITNLPGQPAVKFAQYAVREKELTDRCFFFFFFFLLLMSPFHHRAISICL
jgi:membrane-anchored glycerophosphoryl diester phosphodiesterase (GDPDase)